MHYRLISSWIRNYRVCNACWIKSRSKTKSCDIRRGCIWHFIRQTITTECIYNRRHGLTNRNDHPNEGRQKRTSECIRTSTTGRQINKDMFHPGRVGWVYCKKGSRNVVTTHGRIVFESVNDIVASLNLSICLALFVILKQMTQVSAPQKELLFLTIRPLVCHEFKMVYYWFCTCQETRTSHAFMTVFFCYCLGNNILHYCVFSFGALLQHFCHYFLSLPYFFFTQDTNISQDHVKFKCIEKQQVLQPILTVYYAGSNVQTYEINAFHECVFYVSDSAKSQDTLLTAPLRQNCMHLLIWWTKRFNLCNACSF